jgi:hypothetical protein
MGLDCGFYPGSHPREHMAGSAHDFERARADFEAAWRIFSTKRTEADYQAWRDNRDWTAWKYAMWDAGMKMQTQDGTARCSLPITIADVGSHVRAAHRKR